MTKKTKVAQKIKKSPSKKTTVAPKTQLTTKKTELVSLTNIFIQLKESWQIFISHFFDFLKVWLFGTGALILFLLGITLVLVIIYAVWFLQAISILPPTWLVILSVVVWLIYLLCVAIVNLGLQASFILIASDKKVKNEDIFSLFKTGLKFAPYLLILAVIQLFFFGSFWMLIVPWVLILFLSAFAQYEIVLEKQKPWQAVKNSFNMVSQFTGAVVGRLVLIALGAWGITALYQVAITNLSYQVDFPGKHLLEVAVDPLVYVVVGWFVLSFGLVVYKDVKAKANPNKSASTRWAVVLSTLGWMFFGTTFYFVVTAFIRHWHSLIDMVQQLFSVF